MDPTQQNPWIALWDYVDGETRIQTTEDPGVVILHYPDGTTNQITYHAGRWHLAETLDTCPCDVGARDSL